MVSEAIRHQLYALKTARFTPVVSSSWENRPGQTHAGFKSPFLYIILILVIKGLSGFSLPFGAIHLPSCAQSLKMVPTSVYTEVQFLHGAVVRSMVRNHLPNMMFAYARVVYGTYTVFLNILNTLTWEHVHSTRSYIQL